MRGTRRVWACVILALAARSACMAALDVPYPDGDRAKLDRPAAQELARADKKYEDKRYDVASADYGIFVQQYAKSPAVPYALFQKGRCLQKMERHEEAVRVYEEILDYYPAVVAYAAAALYFMGESHVQCRDFPLALEVWEELLADPDYRQQPVAAGAIYQVAFHRMQTGRGEEALQLYRQGAVSFRSKNPQEAYRCLMALVEHYCVGAPNEPELRKLFKEAGGFDREARAMDPNADVAQDRGYWEGIWVRVAKKARSYPVLQNDLKRELLVYWVNVFKGRFPDWKEYQDQLAAFTREVEAIR